MHYIFINDINKEMEVMFIWFTDNITLGGILVDRNNIENNVLRLEKMIKSNRNKSYLFIINK